MEENIIYAALQNIEHQANIQGEWKPADLPELDGRLTITFEGHKLTFNVEVKTELRHHQLPDLQNLAKRHAPMMIIAYRIFPKIKEELRHLNIAYLEANGNIFFKEKGTYICIDTQPLLPGTKTDRNRAFTKTGLRVVFQFLLAEEFINLPYREIAERLAVGLGNINYVMTGLKEMGFIVQLDKKRYKMQNKKELLDKWITGYKEKLQPDLLIGRFDFVDKDDYLRWKDIPLITNKTRWGGEPAANMLTDYLQPGKFTIYTAETRLDVIKKYKLFPEENGPVTAYRKFWEDVPGYETTVPPLLVYADLVSEGDRRLTETAEKVYDEYLQNKL
jgi:hypothetical protein